MNIANGQNNGIGVQYQVQRPNNINRSPQQIKQPSQLNQYQQYANNINSSPRQSQNLGQQQIPNQISQLMSRQPMVQKIPYQAMNQRNGSPNNMNLSNNSMNQPSILQSTTQNQNRSPLNNNLNFNNNANNNSNLASSSLQTKNQEQFDSFSGSILDEFSTAGGAKYMPESRNVQSSTIQQNKDNMFADSQKKTVQSPINYKQSQPFAQSPFRSPMNQQKQQQFFPTNNTSADLVQQQQIQNNIQKQNQQSNNNLSKQLNQIRTNNQQQKEVQKPQTENIDQNAFKIINKDTGEVFDIRQFDNEVRSPKKVAINPQTTQQDQNTNQQNGSQTQLQGNNAWTDWWNKKRKVNSDFLLHAKINNTAKCIELLDKKMGDMKADVNVKDPQNDWTPLHCACQNGNVKLVSQLLYHEATIDSESNIKQTPLIIASIGQF